MIVPVVTMSPVMLIPPAPVKFLPVGIEAPSVSSTAPDQLILKFIYPNFRHRFLESFCYALLSKYGKNIHRGVVPDPTWKVNQHQHE